MSLLGLLNSFSDKVIKLKESLLTTAPSTEKRIVFPGDATLQDTIRKEFGNSIIEFPGNEFHVIGPSHFLVTEGSSGADPQPHLRTMATGARPARSRAPDKRSPAHSRTAAHLCRPLDNPTLTGAQTRLRH